MLSEHFDIIDEKASRAVEDQWQYVVQMMVCWVYIMDIVDNILEYVVFAALFWL